MKKTHRIFETQSGEFVRSCKYGRTLQRARGRDNVYIDSHGRTWLQDNENPTCEDCKIPKVGLFTPCRTFVRGMSARSRHINKCLRCQRIQRYECSKCGIPINEHPPRDCEREESK